METFWIDDIDNIKKSYNDLLKDISYLQNIPSVSKRKNPYDTILDIIEKHVENFCCKDQQVNK